MGGEWRDTFLFELRLSDGRVAVMRVNVSSRDIPQIRPGENGQAPELLQAQHAELAR